MQQDILQYGVEDSSFQAAGGQEGVFRLVDEFYQQMDTLAEAQVIRAMHPEDMSSSADKLACFLCGWLGGPKLYREKYGSIHIPQAHKPFDIGCDERDAWLLCMRRALEKQPYTEGFKTYLLEQLWRPAERSRTRD